MTPREPNSTTLARDRLLAHVNGHRRWSLAAVGPALAVTLGGRVVHPRADGRGDGAAATSPRQVCHRGAAQLPHRPGRSRTAYSDVSTRALVPLFPPVVHIRTVRCKDVFWSRVVRLPFA